MSNAPVAGPKIIQGCSVIAVTYTALVPSLLKAPGVWGRGSVENCVSYACVYVSVGGGDDARVRH